MNGPPDSSVQADGEVGIRQVNGRKKVGLLNPYLDVFPGCCAELLVAYMLIDFLKADYGPPFPRSGLGQSKRTYNPITVAVNHWYRTFSSIAINLW